MRTLSIIAAFLALGAANATEDIAGTPNSSEKTPSPAPAYTVKDKVDAAVFSTVNETIESLRGPNENHYGVSDDPKLRKKMAEADRSIAKDYEEMFEDCENFISFQGGLVSMLKVVIFSSIAVLIFRAASGLYKGDMSTALGIIMGLGVLAAVVIFLKELIAVLKDLI